MADPVNPAHVIADMEARREDLIALTAALVAAPSANPPGSTSAPARVLSTYLSARGVKHELAAAVPDKPNVVATVQGARSGPHVVLCGHLDTILPGDPTDWSVDLHALTPRGPDLLGLGVGNMKGGLAALAVALAWLHDCRDAWGGRVSLVAVADETVFGPHGAEWLLSTEAVWKEVFSQGAARGSGMQGTPRVVAPPQPAVEVRPVGPNSQVLIASISGFTPRIVTTRFIL